jgi:hypothetical protein
MVAVCVICSGCACKKQKEASCHHTAVKLPLSSITVALHSDLPLLPSVKKSSQCSLDQKRTVYQMTAALDFVQAVAYLKDTSESLGWRLIDEFVIDDQFYATLDRPTKRMMIHAQSKHSGSPSVTARLCISLRD